MIRPFQNLSFTRANNAGMSDNYDPENNEKLDQLMYLRMQEMISSGDPRIKTDMFSKWNGVLHVVAPTSVLVASILTQSLYKAPLWMLVPATAYMMYSSFNYTKNIYHAQVSTFINVNYDYFGENFKKALENHDYRYIANYVPTQLSQAQLSKKRHMFFKIH